MRTNITQLKKFLNKEEVKKRYLFFFTFLLINISAWGQCVIDQTVTGNDNEITGSELVTYINANAASCDGEIVIPNGIDVIINADVTIPNSIDRLTIEDGGQIIWTSNSTLTLQPNAAIVIENTTDLDTSNGNAALSTQGPCNNNRRIDIGNVSYAACTGGGNVCIIYSELVAAGGTIQIDPEFGAIDGTDDQVCFAPAQLNVTINGFNEGVPTFNWTVFAVPNGVDPNDVNFIPNPTDQNPFVEVPAPGVYIFRIAVTVPISEDCLDQSVTVFTDIAVSYTHLTLPTTPYV